MSRARKKRRPPAPWSIDRFGLRFHGASGGPTVSVCPWASRPQALAEIYRRWALELQEELANRAYEDFASLSPVEDRNLALAGRAQTFLTFPQAAAKEFIADLRAVADELDPPAEFLEVTAAAGASCS